MVTTKCSGRFGYADYGYCASHSRFLGSQADAGRDLRRDGARFGLANPKLMENVREPRRLLTAQSASRPQPAPAIVADKGFARMTSRSSCPG